MSTHPFTTAEQARQARDETVEFLRRELIGPDPQQGCIAPDGQEILRPQDPPRMRYGAGVLFPRRCEVAASDSPSEGSTVAVAEAESGPSEEGGDAANETEEGRRPGGAGRDAEAQTDGEVNRANDYLPSAMGLSTLVRLDASGVRSGLLRARVSIARYEKRTVPGIGRKSRKKDAEGNWQEGDWQDHWWRVPIECEEPIEVAPLFATDGPVILRLPVRTHGDAPSRLHLHVFSRPHAQTDERELERIVTFTIVNDHPPIARRAPDADCFFQCGLSIECGGDGVNFGEYPERVTLLEGEEDKEEASFDLLYRHRKTYAIGHGCAADWEPERRVWTETMPSYEIRPIIAAGLKDAADQDVQLSMRALSVEVGDDPLQLCRDLADGYRRWIEERALETAGLPAGCRTAAERHLEGCRKCLDRIERGIVLLASDPDTRTAFAWMNRAMLMQQLHYDLVARHRRLWVPAEDRTPATGEAEAVPQSRGRFSRSRRSAAWARGSSRPLRLDGEYQEPDYENPGDRKGLWRPFQLAFILMNLEGMVQPEEHPHERSLVDLIWFPTGGGKTEAYLGLTAFTIFRRRLRDRRHVGVTVLMRYTLRLLTTQQFQRASSLICACEKIRREQPARLGNDAISIGMWVGGAVTPIYHKDAAEAHAKMQRGADINPFVVLTCPWCGAQMGPVSTGAGSAEVKGYHRARTAAGGVFFACDDPACEFRTESGGLPLHVVDDAVYEHRPTLVIGTVDKFALLPWRPEARSLFGLNSAGMLPPPELIIQDELHLISGALGSMVGHYEGMLEEFCTDRRGGRGVPPKIVASTATIRRAEDQVRALYGGRGVFLFPPQGLQAGESFFAREDDAAVGRRYVGVFASALSSHVTAQIRVLSALLQGVRSLSVTDPVALDPYMTLMGYFNSLRELGHAATMVRADIREYMNAMWDRLDIRRPADGSGDPDRRRFIHRDRELTSRIDSRRVGEALGELFVSLSDGPDAHIIDLCLATNMIQVGLDVPRLGLMAVVGQPKTTSEYIQATSRVGRSAEGPGLVVTIYNPGRPRDRSHYEHFRSYHESIYRWVEPTSVTPFAVPVRERALHAQMIAMARYWGQTDLRDRPQPAPSATLLARIRETLLARVHLVDPDEETATGRHFDNLAGDWRRVPPSVYGGFGYRDEPTPLMHTSGSTPRLEWANQSLSTPTSMRNVDQECCAEPVSQFVQES